MNIKPSIQTAADYLNSHKKLAGILQTANQLTQIGKACRSILPGWFSGCHILKLENGILSISAPSQAIAARLRQKIPLLASQLSQKGWPIHTIRIRILFALQPTVDERPKKVSIPQSAYDAFYNLYKKLSASGESPLTRALFKLIQNRRKTSR